MNAADARAQLVLYLQPDVDPVLTPPEVDALLALARRGDSDGNVPYSPWVGGRRYEAGDLVVPTARNTYRYEVTTAGTSHTTTQPTWPTTSGATVTDGTVVWTQVGTDSWAGTYDLYAAAAAGWRAKAAKVAAEFDFQTDGNQFTRSQKQEQCLAQARRYDRRVISTPITRAVVPASSIWDEDGC